MSEEAVAPTDTGEQSPAAETPGGLPNPEDINRSKMSRALRVDVAHISRIFSGKSNPSLKLAMKIAKYLDITVEGLYSILPKKKG